MRNSRSIMKSKAINSSVITQQYCTVCIIHYSSLFIISHCILSNKRVRATIPRNKICDSHRGVINVMHSYGRMGTRRIQRHLIYRLVYNLKCSLYLKRPFLTSLFDDSSNFERHRCSYNRFRVLNGD